ncbi:hypothetical protein Cni_G23237 [Canna indica]|uniref:Uncharacterized protein n=1 Tax=Canna indica TaxID=4628 RepID=A0AAQ3KSS1_9LILI|nr:hypothetical protein Cni_G23237 [Canna indica]
MREDRELIQTDEKKRDECKMQELSKKMSESFEKILNNKFAKEDFMEEGIDPENSRLIERKCSKERRGSKGNSNLVNVLIGYKSVKLKKRRYSKDTNALGDEGDPQKVVGEVTTSKEKS